MKNLIIVAAITAMIFGYYGCKSFEGAAVTAKPDPIEVHADSIKYEVRASVPPKSHMKKGGSYTGEAKIGTRSQHKVVISTDKYPKIKKTGVDTTVKIQRPYFDDMDGNPLSMDQSYERRGKTFELPALTDIAQCCITTSRLVWENPQFIFSKHEYVKQVPVNQEAIFQFPKNIWEIAADQYKKSDITAIGDFLKKKYNAKKITIEGFASPEGPYKRNVELSVNRSKEVQKWLIEQLKTEGYEEYLDTNFFDISVTHEDWPGFKESVNSLPLDADVKSQVLTIVSNEADEETREQKIMALVGGKDKVEMILSPLRRATIRIEGFEPRRTDEEIDKIAQDFADGKYTGVLKDTYQKEEWMYAISRHENLTGKKALLEAFREAYPGDFRALNDLGAIYLSEGDDKKGLEMLEGAMKVNSKDYGIANNLGVAEMRKKKYKEAKARFETSLSSKTSPEASFNLGVVLEKMAMYNQAIEKFNAASSIKGAAYNSGLCKILTNDLAGAKADLTDAMKSDKGHALAYYVMAIDGARASDASTMTVNLKKACELDSKLKEKAKKDLEFRKFWSSAEFKAATS